MDDSIRSYYFKSFNDPQNDSGDSEMGAEIEEPHPAGNLDHRGEGSHDVLDGVDGDDDYDPDQGYGPEWVDPSKGDGDKEGGEIGDERLEVDENEEDKEEGGGGDSAELIEEEEEEEPQEEEEEALGASGNDENWEL